MSLLEVKNLKKVYTTRFSFFFFFNLQIVSFLFCDLVCVDILIELGIG